MPAVDRAVSTTTDMDDANKAATSEWVQFWRLSDLKLLRSIALPPGPRGDEQRFTGEPRLLPDGKSVYIHTFNCGLYLLRGVRPINRRDIREGFRGKRLRRTDSHGHYWLQTVPDAHALVAIDITDPEHPRDVSSITLGERRRTGSRSTPPDVASCSIRRAAERETDCYVIDFDPSSGALTLDERFRDAGAGAPGVSFTGKTWPHGFTGTARPHGTVFSR